MTAAARFDTLKLADRLGAGGFTAEQAHTAAAALSEALSVDMATKGDVEVVRLELLQSTKVQLEAKIEAVRLQLEARLQETRSDLIKWSVGMAGFQTSVILGARIIK